MKRILISIAALATIAMSARGQSDSLWNIEKCMDYAIHYNLDMKRQGLMLESTSQDHLQSKMDLLPNLNGSLEHDLGAGRVLDRGTYQWENTNVSQGDLGLQSRLTLFAGLQQLNNMKMNKANYLMNVEELEALEDNVILSVMTGYLDLLRNLELADVAEKKVEVTRQQVERMERLVEVGNEPKGKLLEVKAQLSTEKLELTRARNAREIARLNLMHIMALAGTGGIATVTVVASDADGDALTYSYVVSGGAVNGNGASATWTAPSTAGDYLVTVAVTDGFNAAPEELRRTLSEVTEMLAVPRERTEIEPPRVVVQTLPVREITPAAILKNEQPSAATVPGCR